MTQSKGPYGPNTATIYTGETVVFDRQHFLERYYSMHVSIRPDLDIKVIRNHPGEIELVEYHYSEAFDSTVVLEREDAQRVVEVLQEWLGGGK